MRVLEAVADGSPGGGTTHVVQLLRSLSASCQVGLVTQQGSCLARTAHELGVECFEVDPFGRTSLPRVPRRLRRIVEEFKPDLIHAHGSRAGFLVALADPQVPFVYTVHGLHILRRPPLARWLGVQAERLTNSRAALTIFVSQADRGEALRHSLLPGPDRSVVIHNGISASVFHAAVGPDTRHIGYVGRLEAPKDPLLFVRMMDLLPGYHATMIGGGSLEGLIRAAVSERPEAGIRLLGTQGRQETLAAMQDFEVLVVPSLWEAFGLVVLEAMAVGVPVVATRVGGLSEVIEDGVSGLLVNSRSPHELARAVRRVSEDVHLRQRLVEGGKQRVREHFSEEQMLRKVEDAYGHVLRIPPTNA